MKIIGKRRPIDYVNPELSAERAARMWDVVERAQRPDGKRKL